MSVSPLRPDEDERVYLGRVLAAPPERELPGGRQQILRESLMREFQEVASESPVKRKAPAPSRMLWLGLTSAGAAAIAGAFMLSTGPTGGALVPPAGPTGEQSAAGTAETVDLGFTLVSQQNGTLQVRLREFDNLDILKSKLKEAGIDAVVDHEPAGKMCQHPRFTVNESDSPGVEIQLTTGQESAFTLDSKRLKGKTLVIEAGPGTNTPDPKDPSRNTFFTYVVPLKVAAVAGPVKPCVLVDATTYQDPANDEDSGK